MSAQPDSDVVPHPALAAQTEAAAKAAAAQAAAPPPTRSRRPLVIAAIALAALGIGGYEVASGWGKVTTDNAAVDGHVVVVGSRIAGEVAEVRVKEGDAVHQGDVIARLDPADLQVRVAVAEA